MDLISLKLKCPVCGESLMDEEQTVDNSPGIKLNIKAGDNKGTILLSSVYESYNYECDIEIPKNQVVEFSCPHCTSEIEKDTSCDVCEADMYYLNLHMGGKVSFCSRNGCKNHSVEFNQISTALKSLYQEYSYSGNQKNVISEDAKQIEEIRTEEDGIKEIIETGAFLPSYCPHCQKSLIEDNMLKLEVETDRVGYILLSPYLNVFTTKSTIFLKEHKDIKSIRCPHCRTDLMVDKKCGECDSRVAKISVSARTKLLDFYICSKKGCKWHGLNDEDLYEIKLQDSMEW